MNTHDPVNKAYSILVSVLSNANADFTDLAIAIEEAIGYLGEALEE